MLFAYGLRCSIVCVVLLLIMNAKGQRGEKMGKGLYEKLTKYAKKDHLAMHMPGHKRNEKFLKGFPVDIDITEIDGFDNLHDMQGVLLDTAELAAKIYGATMCYPLVNGSSAGILAAITAEA